MSAVDKLEDAARDVAEFFENILVSPRYHFVKPGDSLKSISQHYYGTPGHWRAIYWDNQHIISNPNQVFPGMRLLVSYFPGDCNGPQYETI